MSRKPKCIIITGQPGSGKTTLAKKLGERLWMPVISRDEIKEGYVNTRPRISVLLIENLAVATLNARLVMPDVMRAPISTL